jgi:hypothetical protein
MTHWKRGLLVAVAVGLLAGVVLTLSLGQPALAEGDGAKGAAGGPRYSVIDTEAHNLIVTDNRTNTLYFYTIDKDQQVGAELKLRGSVDLNQVGKATIRISKAKAE